MVSSCPRGCSEEAWERISYDHAWDYRDDWEIPNTVIVNHCDECGEDWDIEVLGG